MQVPVWEQERNCGSLWAEQRGLYTIFRGEVETDRVSRLYAVFESGETALGIPVPECGKMVLRISVPTSRLPQGKLLRGSLRAKDEMWCRFPGGKVCGALLPPGKRMGNRYRFLWRPGERLACEMLMCFLCYVQEGEQGYFELVLDERGQPCV